MKKKNKDFHREIIWSSFSTRLKDQLITYLSKQKLHYFFKFSLRKNVG